MLMRSEYRSKLEFDVEDISSATEELVRLGHRLLVSVRTEP